MKIKHSFIIMMAIAGVLLSCDNKTKQVDANIIDNPSTASDPDAKGKQPVMKFARSTWDFGQVSEGEVVEHEYSFKNTGGKPLLISDVKAECGCTVPVWPREPIMPGQESKIKIQFNSSGKSESINKKVTIYANTTPVKTELHFTAYVKKKPETK